MHAHDGARTRAGRRDDSVVPLTAPDGQRIPCDHCVRMEQISTAIEVVGLFLHKTQTQFIANEEGGYSEYRMSLTPKEEALYNAAMDRLERFLDKEV